jgi:vacuolar protein sorting-associated protein 45
MKDVPNVFAMHQPYLLTLLEQIRKGQLKPNEYEQTNLNDLRGPPNEIIIFQLGGTTYEEAKEIGLLNKAAQQQGQGSNIILGGNYIHNSRTFMAEISQVGLSKEQIAVNIGNDHH